MDNDQRKLAAELAAELKQDPPPPVPNLVAYGTKCVWWQEKRNVDEVRGGYACPHCQGPLKEMLATEWSEAMRNFDGANEGYVEFMLWLASPDRDRCYPNFGEAQKAYTYQTGNQIKEKQQI